MSILFVLNNEDKYKTNRNIDKWVPLCCTLGIELVTSIGPS